MIEPASRPYACASASLAFSCRSKIWLCVQANSKTRSARRGSEYFSVIAMAASRDSATPVTRSIRD